MFYWRASKKFIVLSWKKFIGWPIPNHCSGGQHFLPWDKISSLFFTVQPFSEHLNWTKILEVLAIINCNSKFQNFTGFSTKWNCFWRKKNQQKETENVQSIVSRLRICVNIQFFNDEIFPRYDFLFRHSNKMVLRKWPVKISKATQELRQLKNI